VEDNQVLAWTLRRIAQSAFARAKWAAVRHAWRGLQGTVTLRPSDRLSARARLSPAKPRLRGVARALPFLSGEQRTGPFIGWSHVLSVPGGHGATLRAFRGGMAEKASPPEYELRGQWHVL